MKTIKVLMVAGTAALAGLSVAAFAQSRSPAYAAARAAGEVGEQPDGYLGVVSGGPGVKAIADDINIQRKKAYTEKAQASGATVEQMAVTSGCNLIEQTAPGEKYKGPDGAWKTRTSAPPQRGSNCV